MKNRIFLILFLLFGLGLKAQVVTPVDSLPPSDTNTVAPIILGDSTKPLNNGVRIMVNTNAQIDTVKEGQGRLGIVNGDSIAPENSTTTTDSTRKQRRQARLEMKAPQERDPKIAVRRSAILPGWGQVYNRSAWKVPIIYAGFGVFGYLYYDNNINYKAAKYNYRNYDNPAVTDIDRNRTASSYQQERDFYRRNRDLQVIIAALWYGLNLVDAMVEAHLDGFDVSDDISMRVKPTLQLDLPTKRVAYGAGITFNLKR